jgi:hypothetical protein
VGAADVELILQQWLLGQLGTAVTGVYTETPSNLLATMPLLVLQDLGSVQDLVTLTMPRVDVVTYAAGRDDGQQLAGKIHDLIRLTLINHRTPDGHVLTCTGSNGRPRKLPYNSRAQVWKFGATYQLSLHARRSVH